MVGKGLLGGREGAAWFEERMGCKRVDHSVILGAGTGGVLHAEASRLHSDFQAIFPALEI